MRNRSCTTRCYAGARRTLLVAVESLHSTVHCEFVAKHRRLELAGVMTIDESLGLSSPARPSGGKRTVLQGAACPSDSGGMVRSVWLERQIARCEGSVIIGVHAWSRMAENSSSFMLLTMPAPGFLFTGMSDVKCPSRPATAFRRLLQRDNVLPCPQKRRLRAERPQHCRVISPAYPVGRRGAFGRLRHMSRIIC